MSTNYCSYGCGREAKFQTKAGRWICEKSPNSCLINKKKNSEKVKKAHEKNPEKWNHYNKEGHLIRTLGGIASKEWREKNEEKYNKAHKKTGIVNSENIKKGITKPSFLGKKHTLETKQRISNSMGERNNGFVKTKYYSIFSPYMNKEVRVQGTWEYKYALYLNENKINWLRSRKKHLRYKYNKEDYWHYYYPDFYLPDSNEYKEIKGYYWKSKDGRVDDRLKMEKVKEYNKDKIIIILEKEDLLKLNIKI